MKTLLWTLFFCLFASSSLALEWSEMLPDPSGNDNGKEFIELTGLESLDGCVIRDSASQDVLEKLREGTTSVILIVESDGLFASFETDATVYGAGKAIGNGLGNAIDELHIFCNDEAMLSTTYDLSAVDAYAPGLSLVYERGIWVVGNADGTPGRVETDFTPTKEKILPEISQEESCNDTLIITVGAQEVYPGDIFSFSIISTSVSSYEVFADKEMVSFGDTAYGASHSLEIPQSSEIRIVAKSEQCDAQQRATRIVRVLEKEETDKSVEVNHTVIEKNELVPLSVKPEMPPPTILETPIHVPVEQTLRPEPSRVLVDKDAQIIPWISAFGIATLSISTVLFFHVSRREEDAGYSRSRRKIYKRRKGPSVHEGQRDLQTDQRRMDQGDRHL